MKGEDVRILSQPDAHEAEGHTARLLHHCHDRLQNLLRIPGKETKSLKQIIKIEVIKNGVTAGQKKNKT